MIDNATKKRLDRAMVGAAAGMLRIVSKQDFIINGEKAIVWEVWSSMSNRRKPNTYFVGLKGGAWRCTCPDFEKHQKPCKHILYVQIVHQQRVEV